ncbi:MAG TPA: hypothetical protein VHA33_16465 [Candidatus Angelobacter sp.]|jgi:hypothetical protein|nr:hypothetical protein [Candidatus Angelobacter sp.]
MKLKALIISVVLAAAASMSAQQADAPKDTSPPAAKDTNPPAKKEKPNFNSSKPWRFEYTLTEISGKQRTNVRKFDLLTNNRAEVHSNSRVPVPVGMVTSNRQYSYTEVGLSANMKCFPHPEGEIDLHVEVSMTFLVSQENPSSDLPPVTREIRMNVDTQIKPGVPIVLETVDDVASTHSYELSVTATPH